MRADRKSRPIEYEYKFYLIDSFSSFVQFLQDVSVFVNVLVMGAVTTTQELDRVILINPF